MCIIRVQRGGICPPPLGLRGIVSENALAGYCDQARRGFSAQYIAILTRTFTGRKYADQMGPFLQSSKFLRAEVPRILILNHEKSNHSYGLLGNLN